jgi:hypothetical protein
MNRNLASIGTTGAVRKSVRKFGQAVAQPAMVLSNWPGERIETMSSIKLSALVLCPVLLGSGSATYLLASGRSLEQKDP